MIKTQMYLTQEDYEELRKKAFETKQTMSEIVRQLIKKEFKLTVRANSGKKNNVGKSLLDYSKKYGFKGPRDLASNLDSYLYGKEK